MVPGIDSFKKAFNEFNEQYTMIGGTACDLIMSNEDMDFRATKDLDIVLIIEALTPEFVARFWEYVKEAGYKHHNKGSGEVEFYRFFEPQNDGYPKMIELFARKPDVIKLPEDAILTPIPVDEELSSLSAILLNDSYYKLLLSGRTVVDGISILDTPYIIPFKAKAWIDLSYRKQQGLVADKKDIKKHRNDVFKLAVLLHEEQKIYLPVEVYEDINSFISAMRNENVNPEDFGIHDVSKDDILEILQNTYQKL